MKRIWIVLVCLVLGLALGPVAVGIGAPAEPEAAVENATWFDHLIDNEGVLQGSEPSLAIDPVTNRPFISYYDESDGDLKIAYWRGTAGGNCGPDGTWQCATFDPTGDMGRGSSIDTRVVGSVLYISVSYYDATNHALKLYEMECGLDMMVCTLYDQVIVSGSGTTFGEFSAVKIDANGHTLIAFSEDDPTTPFYGLNLARELDSGGGDCWGGTNPDLWTCEIVDYSAGGSKQSISLDLDWQGYPWITYYTADWGDLKLAQNVPGSGCGEGITEWTCTYIDGIESDAGVLNSFYAAKSLLDTHRVAYYDSTSSAIMYAVSEQGGTSVFTKTTIDDIVDAVTVPSLDLAVFAARSSIVYSFDEAGGLSRVLVAEPSTGFGNCGAGSWFCLEAKRSSGIGIGGFVSAAVDSHGKLYVAHQLSNYAAGETDLKIMYRAFAAFLPGVIR